MATAHLDSRKESPTEAAFIVIVGGSQREPIAIGDLLTVGRDSANSVTLEDPTVSQRHARLERRDGGYVIRDLRSRNGTYVNGARILEANLRDQDRIMLGKTQIVFTILRDTKNATIFSSSRAPRWREQLERLPNLARSELPVLITGPSGAGKEALAEQIHRLSPRARRPLVCVNCSALSESLIESELFGHVRGSFTGATHDRLGAFASAQGGTLFLDEIGDLPLALQPKLLRALENREIRPVGGDQTLQTDVRIVAATHHNLLTLIAEGRFRADLYFRLNVVQLKVPRLTDRMEDFLDLVYWFAKAERVRFSHAALERLESHSWPGNIRELKNLVARARAYFPGEEILPLHLEQLLESMPGPGPLRIGPSSQPNVIREVERGLILERLLANQGNQRRTAADLGMPKSTLHDRLREYGINVSQFLAERGLNP